MKKTKKLILIHCGIMALLGFFVALVYFTPFQCPTKMLFRLPCPFCGLTRAWISAFSADFSAAFRQHPLFLLAPVLIAMFAHTDSVRIKNKQLYDSVLVLIAAVFFIVYVIRMIIYGGKL